MRYGFGVCPVLKDRVWYVFDVLYAVLYAVSAVLQCMDVLSREGI